MRNLPRNLNDRNPIKPEMKFTETPTEKNQIIHYDTFVIKNIHILTFIDKCSTYGIRNTPIH